jgi:DNA-binding NarL/FixJ family response regulator
MGRTEVNWHGSFAVIVTPFASNGDIDEADLFEAIKIGAKGYLLKKLKSDVFFDLIRRR